MMYTNTTGAGVGFSKFEKAAVLAVPVINAAADVTTNYFASGLLSTGGLRIGVLLCIVIVVLMFRRVWTSLTIIIIVLLGYWLGMAMLASDLVTSVANYYSKVFVSIAMVPVGYHYIRSVGMLTKVHTSMLLAAVIIALQMFVAQTFHFGDSVYLADSLYMGGGLVHVTHTLALCILIAPLALIMSSTSARRTVIIAAVVVSIIVMVLVLRRGALLALLAGGIVYGVLAYRSRRVIRYIAIAGVALTIASPLYINTLLPRLEVRSFDNRPIESEMRLWETQVVFNEMQSGSFARMVLGTELFNSQQYFREHYGRDRRLHVDYNIILHGSGTLGLVLYFLLYGALVYHFLNRYKIVRRMPFAVEIRALFIALLVSSLFAGLSHSLSVVGYRATLFLYVGGLLGVIDTLARRALVETRGMVVMSSIGEPDESAVRL